MTYLPGPETKTVQSCRGVVEKTRAGIGSIRPEQHWAVQMDAEKAFVDWAAGEGRIVVHPTTCYGVRECGGSSTFDQSCHWGTDGRYQCLRCHHCPVLLFSHPERIPPNFMLR